VIAAIVSALHVIAVALALSSIALRGRALRRALDADGFRRLFAADNVWGVSALLLIATGVLRAFGGLEKGSAFYLASPLFWTKMALFALVFALEIRPMVTFLRWRRQLARGGVPDVARARALYAITHVEMVLVVVIVFVAAFMARGFGMR
jgi:putative membrane protein